MNEPIRILQVLGSLNAGGMQSMLINYYKKLDRSSFQYDFLVFSDKSFYDDEILMLGGRIYRITPRRRNPIKNYIELDMFFKKHTEYKIVQIHQGINYFAPLTFAKRNHVPIRIVHSHGMDPNLVKRQGIFYSIYTVPKIEKLGTNFVACSESAARQIFSNKIINNKKYKLMRNAIDIEKFQKNETDRKKLRKEFEVDNNFVIGHIGNFNFVKNHDFIIEIFSKVHEVDDSALLVLVGSGEKEEEIRKKVNNLGLNLAVRFLGTRNDIPEVINIFDCLVLPSYYEGLPVVCIEAQAAGIPCYLSSNITQESKVSNLVKFLSINDNAEIWANVILDNRGKYNNTNNCDSMTKNGYNLNLEVSKIEEYYLSLLDKSNNK